MANVICEYDNSSTQVLEPSTTSGRRVRRSETVLRQAAEYVSRGQTFQTVSDMFNIPISTIRFFMARKGILPRRKRGRASGITSALNNTSTGESSFASSSNNAIGHSRSSSPTEPPFHFANYKLPDDFKHHLF